MKLTGYIFGETTREELTRAGIPPRDVEVMVARFGLDDQPPMSLVKVASRFSVSITRVSQIEVKTMVRYLSFRIEEYNTEGYNNGVSDTSKLLKSGLTKLIDENESQLLANADLN